MKKNKININISLDMPSQVSDEYKYKDFHDKVCDYMSLCESDETSDYHWKYLKTIYNKLSKLKRVPDECKPLLKKLEEFMLKHGKYDSGKGHVELDAANMFKYLDDEDK
jgi:hypothetical protein